MDYCGLLIRDPDHWCIAGLIDSDTQITVLLGTSSAATAD